MLGERRVTGDPGWIRSSGKGYVRVQTYKGDVQGQGVTLKIGRQGTHREAGMGRHTILTHVNSDFMKLEGRRGASLA